MQDQHNENRIPAIGLTGGIASGKSTVADAFARRGIPVIDTDVIARMVVAPGSSGLAGVLEAFGHDLLGPDGGLDRARLRTRIFADPEARQRLEELLHPLILAEMTRQRAAAPGPYHLLVIPLLVESGLQAQADLILVVDCPPELQIARLRARDGEDEAGARRILAAQASRADRLAAADDVILNDGDHDALEARVEELDRRYRKFADKEKTA